MIDEVAQDFFGSENFQILANAALNIGQLGRDLLLLHAGQALQLQFDDGLGLLFGQLRQRLGGARGLEIKRVEDELRRRGDQRFARFFGRSGGTDEADHFIDVVEREAESEQDVLALAGFAQFVIGAAAHHIDAMLDEVLDGRDQAQLARLAVDDREIDDAEADLQLRLLVQVIENDVGLLAALQLEDDAHAVAVALVADFRNAFDLLFVHQRGGVFDEARFVDLIRNLGDDDVLAIALPHGLDDGLGANLETAAARAESIENSLTPEDETAGGKIRTLDDLHDLVELRFRMADQQDGGFDDFASGCAAGCWSPCRPRCRKIR